jgi:hypothetical protein
MAQQGRAIIPWRYCALPQHGGSYRLEEPPLQDATNAMAVVQTHDLRWLKLHVAASCGVCGDSHRDLKAAHPAKGPWVRVRVRPYAPPLHRGGRRSSFADRMRSPSPRLSGTTGAPGLLCSLQCMCRTASLVFANAPGQRYARIESPKSPRACLFRFGCCQVRGAPKPGPVHAATNRPELAWDFCAAHAPALGPLRVSLALGWYGCWHGMA